MVMIAGRTERARIAEEIAKVRVEQKRLPIHFIEKRELLAERLEGLVKEWLASE